MKKEMQTANGAFCIRPRLTQLVMALALATGVAGLAAGCASNKGGKTIEVSFDPTGKRVE